MRHPSRFPFVHSSRKVLLDRHLQVGVELVVELPAPQRRRAGASSRSPAIAGESSCRLQEQRDDRRRPLPALHLLLELAPSGVGQRVVLCAPVLLRRPPLVPDPAVLLEPQQGRIDRTLVDLEPAGPEVCSIRRASPNPWSGPIASRVFSTKRSSTPYGTSARDSGHVTSLHEHVDPFHVVCQQVISRYRPRPSESGLMGRTVTGDALTCRMHGLRR